GGAQAARRAAEEKRGEELAENCSHREGVSTGDDFAGDLRLRPQPRSRPMRLLFVADLHYSLKQFDWLHAQAGNYDVVAIGGDLLDLSSPLDPDVQIAIVEKYLGLLRQKTRLVVCSGNHDGDTRNEADESIAEWLRTAHADQLYVDGDGFDLDN